MEPYRRAVRTARAAAAGLLGALLLGGCLPDTQEPVAAAPAGVPSSPSLSPPVEVADSPSPRPVLLQPASGGDGDSWRDTAGREYRLGMVNTPEVGECYSRRAAAERRRLVAGGFRADVYATDRYGRQVAVVHAADGTNVNVHLARHGFADDRYLAEFRHENPSLAADLEVAFTAARRERTGLWGACGSTEVQGIAAPPPAVAPPAAAPAAGRGCHPDYATCIPVKGDGSGRGAANDLDCGDISGAVRLRAAGVDPYRLDADGDGTGCDS